MRMSITGATDENSMQMHEDDFNLEHISLGKSRNGVLNLYAIASLETCAIFTVFSEGKACFSSLDPKEINKLFEKVSGSHNSSQEKK